jgi:hypothetical protein
MTARKRIRQQKAVWPKPGEKPGPPASFRKKVRAFPGAKLALEKVTGAGLNKKLPLWAKLSPEVSRKVRLGNYERLFDAARLSVRAWEKANTK